MERRLRLHNSAHSGAKYTRGRRPVILMYSEEHQTYASVRKRESEVKRFRREQKEKLFNK